MGRDDKKNKLTHFSLFSGIGGIDLSAEWAGFETVGQCEIDGYATKVLEKNFPNVPRWRDIRDVTTKSFSERTGIRAGELTLLSGGFPCQPHSLAGKRMASGDERDLWGEFARVIRGVRPKWVLGENVRGLLSSEHGRFFGRILRDMDEMGYNVGWCCYPASWVGAAHRRERVFIIAYSNCVGLEKSQLENKIGTGKIPEFPTSDTFDRYINIQWNEQRRNSIELRNGDGVSSGVDRLRCLGNAVVPQQVFPILEAIAEIEQMKADE